MNVIIYAAGIARRLEDYISNGIKGLIEIDGKKLIRGENYDYTIDYSMGRVFFTPKNLIHDDSRIYVEFEYSDFKYEKSFIGGSVKNKKFGSGEISFGLYEESDIYNKDIIPNNFNESLISENLNELKIETFEPDENGKYIFLDSIFIFDPNTPLNTYKINQNQWSKS